MSTLPQTSFTVWILPEVGSRQMLGTGTPGDTDRFGYDVTAPAGRHRPMARTTAGAEIASDPFSPLPGGTVQ